jgi:hypothetical protein
VGDASHGRRCVMLRARAVRRAFSQSFRRQGATFETGSHPFSVTRFSLC